MFGLRTKKQITTKFSPYLLFGREAECPCEVPDKYEVSTISQLKIFLLFLAQHVYAQFSSLFQINESVEDMVAEECISECIKRQDRLNQIVQDNMSQVQRKIRKRKLEEGKAVVMQVGDRVLRQNKRSLQRKGGRHKYREITQILPNTGHVTCICLVIHKYVK